MSRVAFQPVRPREIGTPEHCISELVRQAGGIKRVMVRLDVGQATAYGYTSPNPDGAISFAKVAALTQPGCAAAAEYLALLAGGVFLPIAPEDAELGKLCADDMRAHGEAAGCLMEALADGKLTNGEGHKALEKIDAALRALTGLRAAIVEEAKQPGT